MRRFKVVLVGPPGVGKTSLVNRYIRNLFSNKYINTIGCDIYVKSLEFRGETVKLTIHDIGGQLGLREFRRKCLENADIVMVVFAMDDKESQQLGDYIADVLSIPEKPTWAIVGNKLDLVNPSNNDSSEARSLAKEYSVPLCFTSAKDDINVGSTFLVLLEGRSRPVGSLAG